MQGIPDIERKMADIEKIPLQVEFQLKNGLAEFRDKLHTIQDMLR